MVCMGPSFFCGPYLVSFGVLFLWYLIFLLAPLHCLITYLQWLECHPVLFIINIPTLYDSGHMGWMKYTPTDWLFWGGVAVTILGPDHDHGVPLKIIISIDTWHVLGNILHLLATHLWWEMTFQRLHWLSYFLFWSLPPPLWSERNGPK